MKLTKSSPMIAKGSNMMHTEKADFELVDLAMEDLTLVDSEVGMLSLILVISEICWEVCLEVDLEADLGEKPKVMISKSISKSPLKRRIYESKRKSPIPETYSSKESKRRPAQTVMEAEELCSRCSPLWV